jgi:hypothetical protein
MGFSARTALSCFLITGLILFLLKSTWKNSLGKALKKQIQTKDQMLCTNHQSPITNHQSPITNHQSPITNHQSPITNHQSPIPKKDIIVEGLLF